MLLTCDESGYAIPWLADDAVIECGCNDPEADEPSRWLSWTDQDIWQLGPDPERDTPDPVELERWRRTFYDDPPAPAPDPLPGEEQPLDPNATPDEFPAVPDQDDDFEELAKDFEPDPEDQAHYREWCMATDREWWLDQIERTDLEAGCNARFGGQREAPEPSRLTDSQQSGCGLVFRA